MKKNKIYKKTKQGQPGAAPTERKKPEIFTINHKAGIVLGLVAFLLYSNTINGDYVLDDSAAIINNRFVQQGLAGIPDLLKTEFWYFSNMQLGYYRPLSLISFAIEHQFFGNNPHISHGVNAIIFAFSTYILFIILSKLFKTRNYLFPLAISLLFAVHPVHTEVVANIKSRDELLSFANVLMMTWFSLKYVDTKRKRHLLLSLLFFYLALLSKETAFVGIMLLPVLLFFYNRISIVEALKKTIPYLIVILIFFIQKKALLGSVTGFIPDDIVNYPYRDPSVRIPMAFFLFAFSIRLLFIPHPLRYDYSFNQIPAVGFSNLAVWVSLILFTAGIAVILKYYKNKSPLILGLIIFYISSIPLLAFTVLRGGIFAERFLFFPSLGFSIAVVAAISALFKTEFTEKISIIKKSIASKIAFILLISGIAVLYSLKTFSRNFAWKDELTLYSTDIKTGENSVQNHKHLGTELLKRCRAEKDSVKKREYGLNAIAAFRNAIQIHPKFGECYSELGVIYEDVFINYDSAIYYYNKAISSSPTLVFPYFNLGTVYHRLRKYNVASYFYNQAIKVNPQYQDAINAKEGLKKALGLDVQINPLQLTDTANGVKDGKYYFNLGNIYASQQNYALAAQQFKQAASLDNNFIDAYMNLANCYGMLNQYELAIGIYEQLLEKNPDNAQALENIAITYKKMGNTQKAEEYTSRANAVRNK